jgi:hypothetical protein
LRFPFLSCATEHARASIPSPPRRSEARHPPPGTRGVSSLALVLAVLAESPSSSPGGSVLDTARLLRLPVRNL